MTEMSECAQEKSMSASYSRMEDRGGQKKKKPNDTSTAEDTSSPLKGRISKESEPLIYNTREEDHNGDFGIIDDTSPSNKNADDTKKRCCNVNISNLDCAGRLEGFLGKSGEPTQEEFDSLDYDVSYNVPYKEQIQGYTKWTYAHIEVMRWVLVCVIGVMTGFVAFVIVAIVRTLVSFKYGLVIKDIDGSCDLYSSLKFAYPLAENVVEMTMKNGLVTLGFLVLLCFNILFVSIAGILVALRPVAAGSGIPEIKCYLNGVKVPNVTRIGTLVAKVVGVIFSVAGGLLVGKEGPMIHSGSIIGAGVPQFRSLFLKWFRFPYRFFRSDRDKRDFVSSGAAAGVAAAFGAPIGGVLFSLEEGSSFWNQSLTWKTFFCSFSSTFTLNFLISAYEKREIGFLASPGLVDFGVFSEDNLWNAYHLIIFIMIAAVGGLLGALFNSLNITLTKYRMKYLARRKLHRIWRIVEVILIAMATTFTIFVAATFLGTCVLEPEAQNNSSFVYVYITQKNSFHLKSGSKLITFTFGSQHEQVGAEKYETRDLFCPGHDPSRKNTDIYLNDMATLMFQSQESGIKHLFHRNSAFTLPTLLILFICYFFLACWTYGSGVPSGLFIPCLIIGATYGRFLAIVFGYLAKASPYHFGWLIRLYPGTYALIGAASFLGGVVRMTISLTVILIETTNEIEYGLPIMLTLMVAKWVGDLFNHGLYDAHIKLRKTPYLEWESPRQLDKLIAGDVMNSSSEKISYLYPISQVGCIENVLKTTSHSAFLVVTPCEANSIPIKPKIVKETIPQLNTEQSEIHDQSNSLPEWNSGTRRTFSLPENLRQRATSTVSTSASTNGDILLDNEGHVLLFRGLILRHQLTVLLKNKVFFNESEGLETQKEIDHMDLTREYPRFPDIKSIDISNSERNMFIDLSIFMNSNPYTIYKDAPLPQVFTLFRTMGLRHLPVIEESGLVAGIITRHDLTHDKLNELRYKKKKKRRSRAATMVMTPPEHYKSLTTDYQAP